MRRLITSLVVLLGLLVIAAPAEARWCHWGWGGCYRGCGWGGYWGGYPYGGWGGYRYCGWRGYGVGYGLPYVGLYPSYYYPAYNYPLINYGCYGYDCGPSYGSPITIGYYTSAPTYNANANFFVRSLPQPRVPITASVTALDLQRFLDLRGEVQPAIGALSELTLPKMSGRVISAEAKQRAMRYLAEGDTLFQAQNFNSAVQKYKLAASAAPDLAEAFWRQGHAFVAIKRFDLATTAFKRAIALSDDLGRGGFRLEDLYAGASITKAAHLENLAALALSRSSEPDSYFLIGVFLNYDGQAERAQKFFDRANDLAGISGGHIAVFLNHDRPAPAAESRPATPPAPLPALFTSTSGMDI